MSGRLSRASWVALAIAAAVVVVVLAVVAGLWAGVGNSEISAVGWLAMILGAVVALALGIGLMSLVFLSSRRGYDDGAPRR